MRPKLLLLLCLILAACSATAQSYRLHGRITTNKMEPLALVTVQEKDSRNGTTTKEDGSYELLLEEGLHEIVVSMIGYKAQVLTIVIKKSAYLQNLILEEEAGKDMAEVIVKGKARDRSEEIIRNVIRQKEKFLDAPGAFSCEVYIKAVQEDSSTRKGKKKTVPDSVRNRNADLYGMAMAEVVLRLDQQSQQIKEERIGITKRGNVESLFFLSTTEGDFNFYRNLIKAPALSKLPFLSPVSYSGLLAYRFKLLKTSVVDGRKQYTISVKPRQLSNATVEGEIVIADSLWAILHTRFRLPPYHLPEYDFFEVEQQYEPVKEAWMITRQAFTYYSKNNKGKTSGQTVAVYRHFELNKSFDRKYFGTEVSATAQQAYEKDSSFWIVARTEPLTPKEVRFIHYKDSIFRVVTSKAYLDSMDRVINRITWKKALLTGQTFHNHEKEKSWYLQPITSFYQPISFGGARLHVGVQHSRVYKSRKYISLYTDLSYGLRNHDVNGTVRASRLYNPFNRGYYSVEVGRRFDYIFEGDAWINMLKRSNIYLNNAISVNHGLELVNGLFFESGLEFGLRRSVSRYKINAQVDTVLGGLLDNNRAIAFAGYNALYGRMALRYTPGQRYIREPKEKIILGSAWPTFFVELRKGIPGIMESEVDFDYLEMGLHQQLKAGLLGTSNYTIKTGSFLSRRDLRLVDYKWQRRGDPFLFLNPNQAFQALDSTFAVFKRFYQGHYVHEFEGALLNKIPLLKKLGLREMAGGGFLIAPERNLRYGELFAGVERVFKWPFDTGTKFKLGVYVVGSAANQFRNPVQLKIGITSWDRRNNRWY